MKIGYVRVSTQEQNTIRQDRMMESLGVNELYIDKASGKNAQRPELQRMMEYVRKGDTVVVESISRFARNTRDLPELVEQLTAKQVEFVSQKEAIDTTTPTGKFMLTIFGAVAELEREECTGQQAHEIPGFPEDDPEGLPHGQSALRLLPTLPVAQLDFRQPAQKRQHQEKQSRLHQKVAAPAHSLEVIARRHGG